MCTRNGVYYQIWHMNSVHPMCKFFVVAERAEREAEATAQAQSPKEGSGPRVSTEKNAYYVLLITVERAEGKTEAAAQAQSSQEGTGP